MNKNFKIAGIALTVLVVCGVISFLLSSIFWYLYDDSVINEDQSMALIPSSLCQKRVVGYYSEWEHPKVTVKQLKKLTHIIFVFIEVYEDGRIDFTDNIAKERFLDMKKKTVALKSDLKVMVSIGGHKISPRFPNVVADSNKRRALIDSIVSFVDDHDLDGVDIFWIWPSSNDRGNYLKFLQELRNKFIELKTEKERADDYILSIIVPATPINLDNGYYLNEVLKYMDFVNVISYDYYFNGNVVGPHSPLYGGENGNVDETMRYLTCETEVPSKLNMAIPFYGTYWVNTSVPYNDTSDEIWIPKAPETKGPFSVRWNELIPKVWNKNATLWHEESKTSYIWIPETKTFLTFENERSLKEKMVYAKKNNFGGIIIWVIDQDDKKNTLLNVVSSEDLCSGQEVDNIKYTCDN